MIDFLKTIDSNGYEIIISLLAANFIAQFIKSMIFAIRNWKFNLSIMFSTGGMPSSHSATVTSMASSIGLIEGFDSTYFAIGCCFASIVMYDSAGVRRAASRQAKVLNQIIQNLFSNDPNLNKGKLKELLGHTPLEVLAGAILGILVSLGLRYFINYYAHSNVNSFIL